VIELKITIVVVVQLSSKFLQINATLE